MSAIGSFPAQAQRQDGGGKRSLNITTGALADFTFWIERFEAALYEPQLQFI